LRAGVITADTCITAQISISLHNVNNLRIPFCRTPVAQNLVPAFIKIRFRLLFSHTETAVLTAA
jgi:hypothetical protein